MGELADLLHKSLNKGAAWGFFLFFPSLFLGAKPSRACYGGLGKCPSDNLMQTYEPSAAGTGDNKAPVPSQVTFNAKPFGPRDLTAPVPCRR